MNTAFKKISALAALSAAFFTTAAVAAINSYTVNFNDNASTYTDNFKRFGDDTVMTGLAWGAGVGTGGTGGLTVSETAARNLFYRPTAGNNATSTFDVGGAAGGTVFSSTLDFKWADISSTSTTLITAGFTPNNASQTALTSAGALAGSIIRNGNTTVTLRMRNGNADATTLSFDQSALTANNWYRLSYSLTKTETLNTFNYTVSLWSIGADGTATATLFNDGTKNITTSGTVVNSSIYADPDAFFAYDIRGGTTGISHVDNFNVGTSAIPEPAHAAMGFAVFALGFVVWGKRRR
ncbi:MAG: hypothetical protein ABW223_12590 [Rariglobus sp.]